MKRESGRNRVADLAILRPKRASPIPILREGLQLGTAIYVPQRRLRRPPPKPPIHWLKQKFHQSLNLFFRV